MVKSFFESYKNCLQFYSPYIYFFLCFKLTAVIQKSICPSSSNSNWSFCSTYYSSSLPTYFPVLCTHIAQFIERRMVHPCFQEIRSGHIRNLPKLRTIACQVEEKIVIQNEVLLRVPTIEGKSRFRCFHHSKVGTFLQGIVTGRNPVAFIQ